MFRHLIDTNELDYSLGKPLVLVCLDFVGNASENSFRNIFPEVSVVRISRNMKISWWARVIAEMIRSTWRRVVIATAFFLDPLAPLAHW